MDTLSAFAMGQANRGKELMVFDWNKAAKLIKESGAKNASAGLSGDWDYTGGSIFVDNKRLTREESYTYLASTWAVPELEYDGNVVACYLMQSQTDNWNADTFWPDSAVAILEGNQQ